MKSSSISKRTAQMFGHRRRLWGWRTGWGWIGPFFFKFSNAPTLAGITQSSSDTFQQQQQQLGHHKGKPHQNMKKEEKWVKFISVFPFPCRRRRRLNGHEEWKCSFPYPQPFLVCCFSFGRRGDRSRKGGGREGASTHHH